MRPISRSQVMAESAAPLGDLALSALEVVPGLSGAVRFLRAVDDYRARALSSKLRAFLDGYQSQPAADREEMKEKLRDGAERTSIGDMLFYSIDAYTDAFKCELLGRLFNAYLLGFLTSVELRRIAQAIDAAFADDLLEFIEAKEIDERQPWQDFHSHLVASGLMRPHMGWDTGLPAMTDLGAKMRRALRQLAETERSAT